MRLHVGQKATIFNLKFNLKEFKVCHSNRDDRKQSYNIKPIRAHAED